MFKETSISPPSLPPITSPRSNGTSIATRASPRVRLRRNVETAREGIVRPQPPDQRDPGLKSPSSQSQDEFSEAVLNLAEDVIENIPSARRSVRRSLLRQSVSSESSGMTQGATSAQARALMAARISPRNSSIGELAKELTRRESMRMSSPRESVDGGSPTSRESRCDRALAQLRDVGFPEGKARAWKDVHIHHLEEWHYDLRAEEPGTNYRQFLADLMLTLSNQSHLQHLTLARFPFRDDRAMMTALCYRGLHPSPSMLTTLSLVQCGLTSRSLFPLMEFFVSSKSQRGLVTLNLSHNKLNHECVLLLSVCLRSTNILNLNLHGNPLGSEAGRNIADMLSECPRLQSLDIGFTKIEGNDSILAIFNAIPKAINLSKLVLDSLPVTPSLSMTLLKRLADSQTLTEVSLKFNTACAQDSFRQKLQYVLEANTMKNDLGGTRAGIFSATSFSTSMYFGATLRIAAAIEPQKQGLTAGYQSYTTNAPTLERRRQQPKLGTLQASTSRGDVLGSSHSTTTTATASDYV